MRPTEYEGLNSGKLKPTMKRYGFGRPMVERVARECNAKVRVGRSAVYLWDRMDRYLADQADKQSMAK